MTTKYSFCLKKLTASLIIFLFCGLCFAAQTTTSNSNWIIAAEPFVSVQKKNDSISNALLSDIPVRILNKLGDSLFRTIPADENYERQAYQLKNDRLSLFLQLSSAIKKRDGLVLENYSARELKSKISDEEKKIQEIKDKIDENLEKQKELVEKYLHTDPKSTPEKRTSSTDENTGFFKRTAAEYKTFFKNVFEEEEENIIEKISVYNSSATSSSAGLYERTDTLKNEDYESKSFQDEMLSKKINGLLYGQITFYEEYVFVTVSLRTFPGAKIIDTVSEAGTIDELDMISESIAQSITPSISNSLPISLFVNINPPEAAKKAIVYIDEVMYQNISDAITLDAGVHFVQIASENFKNAGTSYFFTGNKRYLIDVELEPSVQGEIYLSLTKDIQGTFYYNGLNSSPDETRKSKIAINGDAVLGQFVAENGEAAFFYIPENIMMNRSELVINAKPFDRNDYIEKYRRKMYNSYSILIISLIPNFVAKGQYKARQNYEEANGWKVVSTATTVVAASCGAWFVYNLIRYFIAADSVIPVEPKQKNKNKNKKEGADE